jgi:type I restriction enzyme S subunit
MKQGDALSLPKGWEINSLGEVCEILNGGTPDTTIPKYWDGENLWITPKDMGKLESIYVDDTLRKITDEGLKNSSAKILPPNSIILSSRAPIGHLAINTKPISTNQGCKGLVPKKGVDTLFLYYFLSKSIDLLNSLGTGATFKELSGSKLGTVEIPLPSLPEQQRIVSILDEAFAAIANAKANAEQNLKNAKELFESYLQGVFENKCDDWEEQLLEDCFKMKSGDNLTAKNMTEGEYPVFGGNGIAGYHNNYNLSGSNVIIGRVGALCGNVRHITENIWLSDNAFKVVDFKFDFDHSFLTYLLNHKDLRSYARQAAQPVISNSSLKDVVLHFPKSLKEQQTIVRQLNALRAETKRLEAIYQQKLLNLEELKKSILQKAFSGELKTAVGNLS